MSPAEPNSFKVADRTIGASAAPFIIAEMSGNHNQSIDKALSMIEAAAKCGAHALKLQTYTADTMTIDLKEREFFIDDPGSLWHGKSLYELYQLAHTPWEWHERLMKRARELGLICFSTPFDSTAVDFLEELDTPLYKIASFENTDLPLIRRVARTGKPMIISTGMATVGEIEEAVNAVKEEGNDKLVLLKCTSSYPADPCESNLLTIPHMQDLFGCQIGLSDHTLGIGAAVAATALGATVIEKHFVLNRADGGVDAAFSLEPAEFTSLVNETETAWKALGQISYGVAKKESSSVRFRRSLYIVKDLKAGDVINEENIRAIRPGYGTKPKYIGTFIGKKVGRDIPKGTPVTWDILS